MSARARMLEEALYEQVATEIAAGIRREGLWAKALSEAGGSPELARAAYITLRAQSLRDEAEMHEMAEREQAAQLAAIERQRELDAINLRVEEIKKLQQAEHRVAAKKLTNILEKIIFGLIAFATLLGLADILPPILQGDMGTLPGVFLYGAGLLWAIHKLREGVR